MAAGAVLHVKDLDTVQAFYGTRFSMSEELAVGGRIDLGESVWDFRGHRLPV